jgi:hypothetical protein
MKVVEDGTADEIKSTAQNSVDKEAGIKQIKQNHTQKHLRTLESLKCLIYLNLILVKYYHGAARLSPTLRI